jgi:flagellar biosynthetic protein FlhB
MALILDILHEFVLVLLLTLMPLLLVNFILAIALESLQTGFNIAFEALRPKVSKINPIEGFKRMFSIKGLVELIKSIAKMAIIFFIVQKAILPVFPVLLQSGQMPIMAAIGFSGDLAFTIAVRVGLFYLFIALLDYFYQRYEFMKQMKMSKQEIKDEYKKLEGDPMIKQRQRDMAMQLVGGRGRSGASAADAVVTNPTHIAVAIKYDHDIMQAPQVVAKGKMLLAEEIKKIAAENNIMVIENPEIARELYATTEVGQEIPAALYSSVAEILALVYDVKKRRQARLNPVPVAG